jgi:hypothetical protein
MSRATREARTKIACAVGALITIKDNDLATKEVRSKLYSAILLGGKTLELYPDTGNPVKNDVWSRKVIRSIDPRIDELGIYTFKTLVWFAHLLIVDLLEITTNKSTKALIQNLHEAINEICFDVVEGHIDVFYDKANALTMQFYQNLRDIDHG